jgi:hypothetical protein
MHIEDNFYRARINRESGVDNYLKIKLNNSQQFFKW